MPDVRIEVMTNCSAPRFRAADEETGSNGLQKTWRSLFFENPFEPIDEVSGRETASSAKRIPEHLGISGRSEQAFRAVEVSDVVMIRYCDIDVQIGCPFEGLDRL